jgi:hypothetical protein
MVAGGGVRQPKATPKFLLEWLPNREPALSIFFFLFLFFFKKIHIFLFYLFLLDYIYILMDKC